MSQNNKIKRLKILICESNFRVLKRLQAWIHSMGYEAFISDNGIDAIKLYKEKSPDIVVVAQKIINIGVIEFIKDIKIISSSQAIIMVLDEEIDGTLFKKSIDLQVDKYLNKPIVATALFSSIDDISKMLQVKKKVKIQAIDAKIQKLEHLKNVIKVKDSFLTVFTHELRTPLNAIINFSDYINKHLSKEKFKKKDILISQVKEITSAGWLMLDMINNLIDAVKLKEDKLEIESAEVSLTLVIDETLSKFHDKFVDIELIKEYAEECIVMGDQIRIKQIMSNLISNAVKYANKLIVVSLKSYKGVFKVEISDDGHGFKDKKKIMHLFEQSSDEEMTRTATGVGIGLYIVRELCNKMKFDFDIGKSVKFGGAKITISGKLGR